MDLKTRGETPQQNDMTNLSIVNICFLFFLITLNYKEGHFLPLHVVEPGLIPDITYGFLAMNDP